jgi:uncharacterized protein
MKSRILCLENDYSFILLGPRGAGKSTLIEHLFRNQAKVWIDLLDPDQEALYQANPSELTAQCESLAASDLVIIDEIQRAPKLLDIAHREIEKRKIIFGFTGSSARKLKRGAANLLAGRAFVFHLFPFSYLETSDQFNLGNALTWGSLPKIYEFESDLQKSRFLKAYTNTYLKEEIQMEQLVRNVPQFRRFLAVAGQMNAKVLNYSKIARDIGCDHTIVSTYFDLLEETLIGFRIPAYEKSIRKQQRLAPKFYFIDTGIYRALSHLLDGKLVAGNYEYGRAFETFIISEIYKLIHYREKEETLSYLLTKDGAEVDLIITRPSKKDIFIEIKSTTKVFPQDVEPLIKLTKGNRGIDAYLVSDDPRKKKFAHINAVHWQEFIESYWNNRI